MNAILDESRNLLVRRWGEMGGYWGINRTMAEIHALLYVSTDPLCTDDIMARLHISRGNASMNLRALVDWGLIQRVHKFGERREYFEADTDVWRMFETIMRERRRREVEPIIATIDRCCELVAPLEDSEMDEQRQQTREVRRRLDRLKNFLTTMGALFELVLQFGGRGVEQLATSLTTAVRPGGDASSNNAFGSRSEARAGAVSPPRRATRGVGSISASKTGRKRNTKRTIT